MSAPLVEEGKGRGFLSAWPRERSLGTLPVYVVYRRDLGFAHLRNRFNDLNEFVCCRLGTKGEGKLGSQKGRA